MKRKREFSSPACFMHEQAAQPQRGHGMQARRGRQARQDSKIRIKRIYDPPARDDGFRVLVDRLWPRGMKKATASLDVWARQLAPSTQLRTWFGHDPERWSDFRKRYLAELQGHAAELDELRQRAAQGPITLLYAAKDPQFNHAVVLQELIRAAAGHGS